MSADVAAQGLGCALVAAGGCGVAVRPPQAVRHSAANMVSTALFIRASLPLFGAEFHGMAVCKAGAFL